jgi:hypothetical protein
VLQADWCVCCFCVLMKAKRKQNARHLGVRSEVLPYLVGEHQGEVHRPHAATQDRPASGRGGGGLAHIGGYELKHEWLPEIAFKSAGKLHPSVAQ